MFENSYFDFEIYGKSHDPLIGMRLIGLNSGISIDMQALQDYVNRRKSNLTSYSTRRLEPDIIMVKEGIKDGVTTGGEIVIEILNTVHKSADYDNLKYIFRPSHADYPAFIKWGGNEDMSGGGKFSGRLTAPYVVFGGICAQILQNYGVFTCGYISSIGNITSKSYKDMSWQDLSLDMLRPLKNTQFPLLDKQNESQMMQTIESALKDGDSIGGTIEVVGLNVPVGLGDSMFDSLESKISSLVFAIPAVKGIEFGLGFDITRLNGSRANDCYYYDNQTVKTYTNNNGGILGGISNGMPIAFRLAIKPTPSIAKPQKTIDIASKTNVELKIVGRHDACIVPRAVVVAESALNIALTDCLMQHNNR